MDETVINPIRDVPVHFEATTIHGLSLEPGGQSHRVLRCSFPIYPCGRDFSLSHGILSVCPAMNNNYRL